MATKKTSAKGAVAKAKGAANGSANGGAVGGAKAAILAEVLSHLVGARTGLAKLALEPLSATQRKDSNGKLRSGEESAMVNILDTMDAFPGVFESLADKDGGVDDSKVETEPSRAHLEVWSSLAPLAVELEAMNTEVSDAMLSSAQSAREVTVAGYAIIRANAPANPKLARMAKPATAFYAQPAKKRAANVAKAARAAKKKAPPAAK